MHIVELGIELHMLMLSEKLRKSCNGGFFLNVTPFSWIFKWKYKPSDHVNSYLITYIDIIYE